MNHERDEMKDRFLGNTDAESRLNYNIQKVESDLKENIQKVESDLKENIQKVESDLKENIQKVEKNYMKAIKEVKDNHKGLINRLWWIAGTIFAGLITLIATGKIKIM